MVECKEKIFTKENFISGLRKNANSNDIEENDDSYILKKEVILIGLKHKIKIKLNKNEINKYLNKLSKGYSFENDILYYKNKSIEAPIFLGYNNEYIFVFNSFLLNPLRVEDKDITCYISEASHDYIFALLCKYSDTKSSYLSDLFNRLNNYYYAKNSMINFDSLSFHIYTVKISTNSNEKFENILTILQSYLFNIAYNYNYSIRLINFSNTNMMTDISRKTKGQLIPFRKYNDNIVNYYKQGVSTSIPLTQYLAFYHVIEYFFKVVSEKNAFDEIQSILTSPSFSPKNKEHIKGFYNRIRKIIQNQKEDDVWDERNALLLCLKKFIPDLESLKNTIASLDESALEFYKNHEVVFAENSPKIDFGKNYDDLYIDIRNRVYSVRNAIVHSKEGEKLRFQPFVHDKDLALEIPLIRAIAEEIIINTSEII